MRLFNTLLNLAKNIKSVLQQAKDYTDTLFADVADHIIDDGNNYIRLKNGLVIQWGNLGVGIGQGAMYADTTITFPVEFANTGYQVLYGGSTSTGAQYNVPVPVTHTKYTKTCTVRVWRDIATSYDGQPWFSWLAIGIGGVLTNLFNLLSAPGKVVTA